MAVAATNAVRRRRGSTTSLNEARRRRHSSRDGAEIGLALSVVGRIELAVGEELDPEGCVRVLFSVPLTSVAVEETMTDVSEGKFWKLLGPSMWPLESLGVTPSCPRSIPRLPLEKIELRVMR